MQDGLGDWTPDSLGRAGVVRPVVTAPNPVLSRPSEEVDPTSDETVQLAADLIETMRVSPGCVGLAAPQVGVGAQVFAVDVTGHPKSVTILIESRRFKNRSISGKRIKPFLNSSPAIIRAARGYSSTLKPIHLRYFDRVIPWTFEIYRSITSTFHRAEQNPLSFPVLLL
jgi:hypothetical protein